MKSRGRPYSYHGESGPALPGESLGLTVTHFCSNCIIGQDLSFVALRQGHISGIINGRSIKMPLMYI